jgi:hypothetical protein
MSLCYIMLELYELEYTTLLIISYSLRILTMWFNFFRWNDAINFVFKIPTILMSNNCVLSFFEVEMFPMVNIYL